MIGGVGFDPRAVAVGELLSAATNGRVKLLLLREMRPSPSPELLRRANATLEVLSRGVSCVQVIDLEVFAEDGAVIGGRQAVGKMPELAEGTTDVVMDFSALSTGIAFPVAKLLFERCAALDVNLHLMAVDDPAIDQLIRSQSSDRATPIPFFSGDWGLDGTEGAAKLWLPQLVEGGKETIRRIFDTVGPDDVCPILPFPSSKPRRADELIAQFEIEFESIWKVGAQNIIYAAESDPLDLYRSILRVDDLRSGVFREVCGAITVLSPLGTKVMSLGTLMAALERQFPVFYVESLGYTLSADVPEAQQDPNIVHVWLLGEAYAAASATVAP